MEEEDIDIKPEEDALLSALYMSVMINMIKYKGEILAPEIQEFLEGAVADFEEYEEEDKTSVLTYANEVLRTKDTMRKYH